MLRYAGRAVCGVRCAAGLDRAVWRMMPLRGSGDEDENALPSAPRQSNQRTAAGHQPPPRHRSAAAHAAAYRVDAPPADRARGRTCAFGARPARRTRRPADLGQTGYRAAALAPCRWHPDGLAGGGRLARAPGPPDQHTGHRHRAETPHHRGPASLVAGPPRSGGDAADPGARVRRACRRAGAPGAGRGTAVAHGRDGGLPHRAGIGDQHQQVRPGQAGVDQPRPPGRLRVSHRARRRPGLRHRLASGKAPRPSGHALSGRSRTRPAARALGAGPWYPHHADAANLGACSAHEALR